MTIKRSITGWRQVKPERVPSKRRYLPLVAAKPAASPETGVGAAIAAKPKIQQ